MPGIEDKKKLLEDLRNIRYYDRDNEDQRLEVHEILKNMADEGMITLSDGTKTDSREIDFDSLDKMYIRANDQDDPYVFNVSLLTEGGLPYKAELSEKPLTQEEFTAKNFGPEPKKPGFFRSMLNGIKKNIFRMKDGDAKYHRYEKAKAEYDEKVYYGLKNAGYDAKKPEHIAKNEREMAVRSYVFATNAKNNVQLPENYKVTDDPKYQQMMSDPHIDTFVDAPMTQEYLKHLRECGFKTPETLTFSEGKSMFRNYADDPELVGGQNRIVGRMVVAGNAMTEFEDGKRAEAAKANRQNMIEKRADNVMREIGMKIDVKDNERFLNELNTLLRKDTPASNKLLSVMPKVNPVMLTALSDEFERNIGNKDYSLENKLSGLVSGNSEAKAELREQIQELKESDLNNAKDEIDIGSLGN